jgi:CubicO group peptidase (beta-lactamase class C family)
MGRMSDLRRRTLACLLIAPLLLWGDAELTAQPLPTAAPAAEGFSPERLDRLHARLQRFVDEGQHAGLITLIARNGKVVDSRVHGFRDRARQLPMQRDTIVRIYSMTKVITSVAVMMLVEEGRLRLDDPVRTYLPAFAAPKVFTGGTAAAPRVSGTDVPITIRHLLTHTSGLIYGFGSDPIDGIYTDAKVLQLPTLEAFVSQAASLPLVAPPGDRFAYGLSTDVLGAVVQEVSGEPFDEFIRRRILEPLGMTDTGFTVPESKRGRLAIVYTTGKDGGLVPMAFDGVPYPDPLGRTFPSGGGGLFSTIDDYARFGQMLLNGGELDGVRLLGRKTVETMRANHLAHLDRPSTDGSRSEGFGLGGSVRLDLASGAPLGSVGQFGWSGAATTYFNIDPVEGTLALVFAQHMPFNEHDLFDTFSTMMYAALVDAPRP